MINVTTLSWTIFDLSRLTDQATRFVRGVGRYRNCCVRIEDAIYQGRLTVTDVELVYCASFLSVCSKWEVFLEEILYETICGEPSRFSSNQRYVTFTNRQTLTNVLLFPGRSYLSIPNLTRAEELAELFIKNGRPISAVSEENKIMLKQAINIRNAIAHASVFARRKFRESVPGVDALPTRKRLPGAFLRHEFRQHPRQRRYEIYFVAYQSAANEIMEAW